MSDMPIQIVDEHDVPIRSGSSSEAQEKGLWHRIVRIMVEDGTGSVLLQKRLPNRKLFPNRWDNSAAGHVDYGESFEIAAARELNEEIGLSGVELYELGYYQTHGTFEGRKLNRFNKAYKVVVPYDTQFTPQPEEVATTRWYSIDEMKQLAHDAPDKVTDGILEVVERFYT
jgi:isopentenyl-diphosphate delta-isomerase